MGKRWEETGLYRAHRMVNCEVLGGGLLRDSLMPSRGSRGNRKAAALLIGGAVLIIIAVVVVLGRGEADAPSAPAEPAPANTSEALLRTTPLVAPQPTRPTAQQSEGTREASDDNTPTPQQIPKKKKVASAPSGTIDTKKYNDFINSRFGQVRSCYERRLKVNQMLQGVVDVNISVNDRGWVNWITVKRDTVRDDEMLACIKKTIRSWQFPSPEGGRVVVGKTFNFKRKGV